MQNPLTTNDKIKLFNYLNYDVNPHTNTITYSVAAQVAHLITHYYDAKWVPTDKPLMYQLLLHSHHINGWVSASQVLPHLLLSVNSRLSQESMKQIVDSLTDEFHYDNTIQHQLFQSQLQMNLKLATANDNLRNDEVDNIVTVLCDYCDVHVTFGVTPTITLQFPDSLYVERADLTIYQLLQSINRHYNIHAHHQIMQQLKAKLINSHVRI